MECASTSESYRKKIRSHLAPFAAWALSAGRASSVDELLNLDLIERYIAVGMPTAAESTRATRRAILRRVAYKVSPALSQLPRPEPIPYRRVRAPYSAAEVEGYLRLGHTQPTPGRRRSILGILTLGLGCGLDSQDLAWVRGIDVATSASGTEVTICGGSRPRTVTALSDHEALIARLARVAGEGLLIGGTTLGRHNVTSTALGRMVGDRTLPPLVVARLRSTWLVTHLDNYTPLPALMRAAGLRTVRPLEDLLDYASAISPEDTARYLRASQ